MSEIDVQSSSEAMAPKKDVLKSEQREAPPRTRFNPELEIQGQKEDRLNATRVLLEARGLSPDQVLAVLMGLKDLDGGRSATLRLISVDKTNDNNWFYDSIEAVREMGKWPFPELSEWKQGAVDKVEVVVHPFFSPFIENFDSRLWDEAGRDPEKYIDSFIVRAAQIALGKLKEDPSCIPLGYFLARDMLEEREALKAKVPERTLRVLDLSRRSLVPDPLRVQAYDALLKTMGQERTVFVDSYDPGTGRLQDKDLVKLNSVVQTGGDIEVQGGYLNACVDAATRSIVQILHRENRNDVHLAIDSVPSTGSASLPDPVITRKDLLLFEDQISEEMKLTYHITREELDHLHDFQKAYLEQPTTPLASLADVKNWIAKNDLVNKQYDEMIKFKDRVITHMADNEELRRLYSKIFYK